MKLYVESNKKPVIEGTKGALKQQGFARAHLFP